MKGGAPEEEGWSSAQGRDLLGVLLAGGKGRRFGRHKPLEPMAGRPMAAWALDALRPHFPRLGTVANDPRVGGALGIPSREDRVPGLGPLGGLWTALEWAREEELTGVFLLACDLPLVDGELVGRILQRWPPGSRAVVPESRGPRGMEPLCAGYRLECLPAVASQVRAGSRSMAELLDRVEAKRIPMEELGGPLHLERAFLNVNTMDDARWVEGLLRQGEA